MTPEGVRELKTGDWVFWQDPDDGIHSRYYHIGAFSIKAGVVLISEPDGSVLECYPEQLHTPDPYIRGAARVLVVPEESITKHTRQLFKVAFMECLHMRIQDDEFIDSVLKSKLRRTEKKDSPGV